MASVIHQLDPLAPVPCNLLHSLIFGFPSVCLLSQKIAKIQVAHRLFTVVFAEQLD